MKSIDFCELSRHGITICPTAAFFTVSQTDLFVSNIFLTQRFTSYWPWIPLNTILVPILNPLNPVHALTPFWKRILIIYFPLFLGFPSVDLPSDFWVTFFYKCLIIHAWYMPCLSNPPSFNRRSNIRKTVQMIPRCMMILYLFLCKLALSLFRVPYVSCDASI
jgi:hypothetical protein